jgi:hypothetical protein
MAVRIEQLTLGELALVEKKTGQTVGDFAEKPSVNAMLWLAFVMRRREDPTFTEKMASELTLDQASEIIGGAMTDDPTPAGSSANRPSG